MARPVPVGGWPQSQGGRQGASDPAKEENAGNQDNTVIWGDDINNTNNNDTGGGTGDNDWDKSGAGGDTNNNDNQGNSTWDGNGDQNQNQSGDSTWENNGQQATNDAPNNWDSENNNQNDWNNNTGGDQFDQNNQAQAAAWEYSSTNAANNQQSANGWLGGSDKTQAQSNNLLSGAQQSNGPAPLSGTRQSRPLYGPYGAYYSVRTATTDLDDEAQAEEEPPYDVPETVAQQTGTTHQVQPGKGYLYLHKRASPEYIDTTDEPYARFVFKYRTRGESAPRFHDGYRDYL